jgi:hypothetical protein
MGTKYIHHIHLPSPSLFTLPSPTDTIPDQDLFYLPVVYIDYSRRFFLVILGMYILYLNQISPLYYLLFLYALLLHYLMAFSASPCTIFIHRCIVVQYHPLSIILLSSPASLWSPQTDPLIHSWSLSLYVCVCVCVYVYVCACIYIYRIIYVFMCALSYRFSFHIWGKTCDFCPSEPGLLHLTWWLAVPSIYL